MNALVQSCAIVCVVLFIVKIVIGPFLIGYKREPMTATDLFINSLFAVPLLIVAGRILRWW